MLPDTIAIEITETIVANRTAMPQKSGFLIPVPYSSKYLRISA